VPGGSSLLPQLPPLRSELLQSVPESQAERVIDKDRANFCDYFKFKDSASEGVTKGDKDSIRKKLDDLFK